MKKIFGILSITILLASCSGSGEKKSSSTNWNDEEKTAFSTNCESGASPTMGEEAAKNYCDCMLDKIMVKYPEAENVGAMNVDEMTTMAQDCI